VNVAVEDFVDGIVNGLAARFVKSRELRPAVIARKLSHCSRNERGARAFEAFTSVIQTLRKTTTSTIGAAFAKLLAPVSSASP
jgi:hypothetical protein